VVEGAFEEKAGPKELAQRRRATCAPLTGTVRGAMIVVVREEVMRMVHRRTGSMLCRPTCHQYPQSEVMTG